MKVLFMTNIPSPYRVDFFNELGKYCELTVTFEGKTATDRDKKWKATEFQNFKAHFMNGIRTKSDQFLCFEIIKVIKSGFNRIIVGGYSTPTAMLAIEYMRILKIPFWIEADGGLLSQDSSLKYKVKHHFISASSGWFSSGKETSNYLIYYGALKGKIFEYPFSSLREVEIRKEMLALNEKKMLRKKLGMRGNNVVVSVGQFIRRKGFDVLLKAWNRCPIDSELYIIGSDPIEEYTRLKKDLKLDNVYFVGFKQKQELKEYYQAADFFVLPTREDIWGLVVNEAMAEGLPVITTTRCVAGLELVKDGVNGYLVPPDNVDLLVARINNIIRNKELREEMAKNCLKAVSRYTIENMARVHYKYLKEGVC